MDASIPNVEIIRGDPYISILRERKAQETDSLVVLLGEQLAPEKFISSK